MTENDGDGVTSSSGSNGRGSGLTLQTGSGLRSWTREMNGRLTRTIKLWHRVKGVNILPDYDHRLITLLNFRLDTVCRSRVICKLHKSLGSVSRVLSHL